MSDGTQKGNIDVYENNKHRARLNLCERGKGERMKSEDEKAQALNGGVDYEVGFGKPPRQTRFRKGESGNPKGRPRGLKNPAALLSKVLREPVIVIENGQRRSITKYEALMRQLATNALRGDYKFMRLLIVDQLPKLQEYEDRRAAAAQEAQPSLSSGSLDLFTNALELVLASGAGRALRECGASLFSERWVLTSL
jgi:hypothetical protein